MEVREFSQLVDQLSVDAVAVSNSAQCVSLLTRLNRLRSWAESCSLSVTQRLNALPAEEPGIFPEQMVADATRVSLTQAIQPFRRAAAVELLPEFGAALTSGAVNVDHVDVLSRTVAGLDAQTQQRLAARDGFLTEVAARTTANEFGRTLRDEVRRAQHDDGIARLERQRRNTRLRTWVDRETGMWCLRGEFDPETGAILQTRLTNAIEALFHDTAPDTCPTDPLEKQHHLRALALFAITAGNGAGRAGTIDMSILVDAQTLLDGLLHDHTVSISASGSTSLSKPSAAWAAAPTLPRSSSVPTASTSNSVAPPDWPTAPNAAPCAPCTAAAPSPAAAWPGTTSSSTTSAGSATVGQPTSRICCRYAPNHHLAHEGRWELTLDLKRNLTITKPDGTTMTTGPPKVVAA